MWKKEETFDLDRSFQHLLTLGVCLGGRVQEQWAARIDVMGLGKSKRMKDPNIYKETPTTGGKERECLQIWVGGMYVCMCVCLCAHVCVGRGCKVAWQSGKEDGLSFTLSPPQSHQPSSNFNPF